MSERSAHEVLPKLTVEGLETLLWVLQQHHDGVRGEGEDVAKPIREAIIDDAVREFLNRIENGEKATYPASSSTDTRLNFWVDSKLHESAVAVPRATGLDGRPE